MKHIIILTGIAVAFTTVAFLGAKFPDFYPLIDKTPPLIQLLFAVVPMTIFALWRLKKILSR